MGVGGVEGLEWVVLRGWGGAQEAGYEVLFTGKQI